MTLDVPVLTELHERFLKAKALLHLIQGTYLPFPFEGTGAVLLDEQIQPRKSGTVFSPRDTARSERLTSLRAWA